MRERDLQKVRAAGFTVVKCSWVSGWGTILFVNPDTPRWKQLFHENVNKVAFQREIANVLSGTTMICIQYI